MQLQSLILWSVNIEDTFHSLLTKTERINVRIKTLKYSQKGGIRYLQIIIALDVQK